MSWSAQSRGARLIDEFCGDLRYGLRWVSRSPGFTAVAILSLSLGIGANTAIFSLLDQLLFRSLPVSRPEELVLVAIGKGAKSSYRFSYRSFQTLRQSAAMSDILALSSARVTVETAGSPEIIARGLIVSGNYFTTLGVAPSLGRLLHPSDDLHAGGHPVVVLSHSYWQRQFAGDERVVGREIRLNGYPFTVVGVSAAGFSGTDVGSVPDVVVPLAMQEIMMPDVGASMLRDVGAIMEWLELMGRLAPGVSPSQAAADLNRVLRVNEPGGKKADAKYPIIFLEPGRQGLSELRRRFAHPLLVLMGVVALVLLIACANVASLFLARAETRRREFAVRVALGAQRGRLVRQLLTESLVVAALGGLGGLALAWMAANMLAAWVVPGEPGAFVRSPDLRVLSFTVLVSLATGIGFGLVPAWSASRVDAAKAQHSIASDAGCAQWRPRLGRVIVGGQVAVSLVLLVMAGLFVRTLTNLREVDVGFATENVLAIRLEPPGSGQKWRNMIQLDRFYRDLLERVRLEPGVQEISLVGDTPISTESLLLAPIGVPGHVPEPDEKAFARLVQLYPGYFSTLGIRVSSGRELEPADSGSGAPLVAVINQTMAERYFGSTNAVGKQFSEQWLGDTFRVVGVVPDVRDRGLREAVLPIAYTPFLQTPSKWAQMTLLVRTNTDLGAMSSRIRQLTRTLEPRMPPPISETIADRLNTALRQERLLALVSSLFGTLGLTLACVGLYGVMAYAASRRRVEFGVRMALGADTKSVRRMVLVESLSVVGAGALLGLLGAGVAAPFLSNMFFGLAPLDPTSFAAATAILGVLALLVSYASARHSSRIDPVIALRQE